MLTVFLCIPMLNNAGAQRFVTELALSLNNKEFLPIVVTTRKNDISYSFVQQLLQNSIDVIDVSDKNYFKQIFKTKLLIKKYKPDIVHTNIGSALHMLIPVWMSKTVHIFTAHSMGYRIFSGAKKKIMKIAFKLGKVIPVAICDTVKKSICESYGLPENKIPCVYNGVDTSKFHPKKEYCKDETVHFVSVGTLYELKNHRMLIDAFALVRKECSNVKLTIVGGGELFDSLNQQIVDLGLERDVVLAGNRSNVQDYLQEADVYCCPSKVEGLPITVLEAMSTGLPIITTPAGGVIDIVKDGVNGYIVPHGDVESMAEKMIAFVNNGELIRKTGHNSRNQALAYDIKLCARGYEKLYKKFTQ